MTSEMENILKGKIESTVDYNTSKKIIGISTSNLTPNENGIAPLEKQGAFQQIESLDLTEAINTAQSQEADPVVETLDLPVLDDKEQNAGSTKELKVPQTSDVIVDSPVQVESPEKLDGFTMPEIMKEEVVEQVNETNEPVAIDIQMPTMPETIVANEPDSLNENIFEGIVTDSLPKSILENEVATESIEEVVAPAENTPSPVVETINESAQPEPLNLLEETLPMVNTLEETSLPEEVNTTLPEVEEVSNEQTTVPEVIDIDKILENQKNDIIANFDNIKVNLSSLIENIDKAKAEVEQTFEKVIQEINKAQEMQSKIKAEIMPVTEEIQNLSNQGNTLVDDAIDRINAMASNGLTM